MHGADLHKRSFLTDGGKDNERQKKKAVAVIRSGIRPVTTAAFDLIAVLFENGYALSSLHFRKFPVLASISKSYSTCW